MRTFDLTLNTPFQSAVPPRPQDRVTFPKHPDACDTDKKPTSDTKVQVIGFISVARVLRDIGQKNINKALQTYGKNNQIAKLEFAGLVLSDDQGNSSLDDSTDAVTSAEQAAQQAYESAVADSPELSGVPAIIAGAEQRDPTTVGDIKSLAMTRNTTVNGLFTAYATKPNEFSPEDLNIMKEFSESNFVMVAVAGKANKLYDCTFGPKVPPEK